MVLYIRLEVENDSFSKPGIQEAEYITPFNRKQRSRFELTPSLTTGGALTDGEADKTKHIMIPLHCSHNKREKEGERGEKKSAVVSGSLPSHRCIAQSMLPVRKTE